MSPGQPPTEQLAAGPDVVRRPLAAVAASAARCPGVVGARPGTGREDHQHDNGDKYQYRDHVHRGIAGPDFGIVNIDMSTTAQHDMRTRSLDFPRFFRSRLMPSSRLNI